MDGAGIVQPAEFLEDQTRWAETREDRLDEVGADEGGQEQPPRADFPGERGAEQDKRASEEANE